MADSYIGVFEFGSIVHTGNGSFSLGYDAVIVNVVGQQTGLYNIGVLLLLLCRVFRRKESREYGW